MIKKYTISPFLMVLSILFISFSVPLFELIPKDFLIATSYSTVAVAKGYSDYFSFAIDSVVKSYTKVPETETASLASSYIEAKEEPVQFDFIEDKEIKTDFDSILISNETDYNIDINELLQDYKSPAKKEKPHILIVHTHATEGYIECDNRSLDNEKNVTAVGEVLAYNLREAGFMVIHDKTHHDYPNYNGSYSNSLATVSGYLSRNPEIDIVLDLHRDGIVDEKGNKIGVSTDLNGQKVAKLMFVVGTDACGLSHPDWRENLKFATGLQNVVNSIAPSVMRPINLRKERFNQHTTKNSIIIECGSNGNSLDEAKRSAYLLAKAISLYIK